MSPEITVDHLSALSTCYDNNSKPLFTSRKVLIIHFLIITTLSHNFQIENFKKSFFEYLLNCLFFNLVLKWQCLVCLWILNNHEFLELKSGKEGITSNQVPRASCANCLEQNKIIHILTFTASKTKISPTDKPIQISRPSPIHPFLELIEKWRCFPLLMDYFGTFHMFHQINLACSMYKYHWLFIGYKHKCGQNVS